jgi:hypothetical protein
MFQTMNDIHADFVPIFYWGSGRIERRIISIPAATAAFNRLPGGVKTIDKNMLTNEFER